MVEDATWLINQKKRERDSRLKDNKIEKKNEII